MNTLFGSKIETSQSFVNGLRIPVTKITAGPCVVTQIKNMDKDGYWAVQFGFDLRKSKNTSKPLQGHLKSSKKEEKFPRHLKEVRFDSEPEFKVGDVVNLSDVFKVGDVVEVTGVSKGKGFAGGMKLHGFHGGPKTHGQSDRERAPGSIGQTTTPGRVYKGKRMAARMGSDTVTVKNLHVISADKENNLMEISGQLPGRPGAFLVIHKIKEGSLADLEHEVAAQVVEGEAKGEEAPQAEVKAPEGGEQNA